MVGNFTMVGLITGSYRLHIIIQRFPFFWSVCVLNALRWPQISIITHILRLLNFNDKFLSILIID